MWFHSSNKGISFHKNSFHIKYIHLFTKRGLLQGKHRTKLLSQEKILLRVLFHMSKESNLRVRSKMMDWTQSEPSRLRWLKITHISVRMILYYPLFIFFILYMFGIRAISAEILGSNSIFPRSIKLYPTLAWYGGWYSRCQWMTW